MRPAAAAAVRSCVRRRRRRSGSPRPSLLTPTRRAPATAVDAYQDGVEVRALSESIWVTCARWFGAVRSGTSHFNTAPTSVLQPSPATMAQEKAPMRVLVTGAAVVFNGIFTAIYLQILCPL